MKLYIIPASVALKLLLFCLIVGSLSTGCMTQNNKKKEKVYKLGRMGICPAKKAIYGEEMIGGTDTDNDGNTYHWDGTRTVQIKGIGYNNTAIVVSGHLITFKEFCNPKFYNKDFKVLRYNINGDGYIIGKDKKNLYLIVYANDKSPTTIDISHMEYLKEGIFRDNAGKLFFYPYMNYELIEVPAIEGMDMESLKHIASNYYMDKNGLYWFGWEFTQSTKDGKYEKVNLSGMLEPSHGKDINPILMDGYFIYGDAVYDTKSDIRYAKLNLKGSKLIELPLSFEENYLTDGDNIYNKTYDYYFRKVDKADVVKKYGIKANLTDWKILTEAVRSSGYTNSQIAGEDNTYYFPTAERPSGSGFVHKLIHAPDGFYLGGTKLDKVMIRNYDTRQYEPLEADKFRRITDRAYIYKKRIYSYDCTPIIEDIDTDKLHQIKKGGIDSYFYTDGKILLHSESFDETKMVEDTEEGNCLIFRNSIERNVDFATLKIINQNMAMDKNNIYSGEYYGMEIIPIKEIKIEVIDSNYE